MSWIRLAVNKAVEVGGNNNLTRAVRSYAGGAKMFQDRNAARNLHNCKLAIKRLEEVSVSCRGAERVQLMRRWLVALKEVERLNESINTEHLDMPSESNDSPPMPTVVLYYDPDLDGEPLTFHDVFILSQALEGITLSLILELPNEEEISLLLEIFGLCLTGGKEAHNVTVNYVRDLAKAFSTYDEEVLAEREELLHYAQDAIAGLKLNAEIVRIDSEATNIHEKLDVNKKWLPRNEGNEKLSEAAAPMMSTETAALSYIELCSRLKKLLLRKKLMKSGDSPTAHNLKVDKLKVLAESLASSTSKTEKRISDNRTQKEEALKFRVAKTSEVSQLAKDLAAEVEALEKQKGELEVELKKVTAALTSTHSRLQNTKEERDQFDEASNQIIKHFKLKDDELARSVASYSAEAKVCNTYINFLESTWRFQSSYAEQNEKLVNDELERHEEFFVNLAVSLLATYKEELGPSVSSIRKIVSNLNRLDCTSNADEKNDAVNSRRSLEEQYQSIETKFLSTFSVVESIKKQFDTQPGKNSRNNEKLKDLLDTLEKMISEFESIERPTLQIETPTIIREESLPSQFKTSRLPFLSPRPSTNKKLELNIDSTPRNEAQRGVKLGLVTRISLLDSKIPEYKQVERQESLLLNGNTSSDAAGQLAKLRLELELENNHNSGDSMDGISDWEFDEPKKSI